MEETKNIVAYDDNCNFLDISNFELDNSIDNNNLDNNLINEEVTNNNDIIDHLDKMFSDINSTRKYRKKIISKRFK